MGGIIVFDAHSWVASLLLHNDEQKSYQWAMLPATDLGYLQLCLYSKITFGFSGFLYVSSLRCIGSLKAGFKPQECYFPVIVRMP